MLKLRAVGCRSDVACLAYAPRPAGVCRQHADIIKQGTAPRAAKPASCHGPPTCPPPTSRTPAAPLRDGTYQLPWDMTTVSHRQYNPLFVLSRSALYLNEAVQTLSRRVRNQPEPVWLSSSLYPDYFQKTFHYQTDGWFSQR